MRVPEWTLSDRLMKARTSAGFEQSQLSEVTGLARATISAAENGHRTPTKANLNLWALATGVPIEWILTGKYTPRDLNPEPTVSRFERARQSRGHLRVVADQAAVA